MNFSFSCKYLSFAKAGSMFYLSINDKRLFTVVGNRCLLNIAGKEFKNFKEYK